MAKIALSAEFQAFSWKFRPLTNIFQTLEKDHSIRHQSIPPPSASRNIFCEHFCALCVFTPLALLGVVAHDCGYPLSRYTCRAKGVAADFLDFRAFCRCSTGVMLHPLKLLVSHLPPPLAPEVSHRNLGLKRCRATRGCRSYSCGCRATLCSWLFWVTS